MSIHRIARKAGFCAPRELKQGETGRPLCRQCGTEVPAGRRTFCGDACVHDWRMTTDPSYVRRRVLDRDHGVCSECGADTLAIRQELIRITTTGPMVNRHSLLHLHGVSLKGGRYPVPFPGQTLWEAHHKVPVTDGGGECGLDNYITLCWWCHRSITAAWRRAKARARKQKQDQGAMW